MIIRKLCIYFFCTIIPIIWLLSVNNIFANDINTKEAEDREITSQRIKLNAQKAEDDILWRDFTRDVERTNRNIYISLIFLFLWFFPVLIGLYFYDTKNKFLLNINIKSSIIIIILVISIGILFHIIQLSEDLYKISDWTLITVFSLFNREISSNINSVMQPLFYPYFSSILKFITFIILPYLSYFACIIFIWIHLKRRKKVENPLWLILKYTIIPLIILFIIILIFSMFE